LYTCYEGLKTVPFNSFTYIFILKIYIGENSYVVCNMRNVNVKRSVRGSNAPHKNKNTLYFMSISSLTLDVNPYDLSLYLPSYKGFQYCVCCFHVWKNESSSFCPRCGRNLYKDTGDLEYLMHTYWNSERHLIIRKKIDDYLNHE